MPTFAFPGPKTAAPAASDAARLSELEKYTARLVDYLRFLLSSLDAENLDVDVGGGLEDTGWRKLEVRAEGDTGIAALEPVRVRRSGRLVSVTGKITVEPGQAGGETPLAFALLPQDCLPETALRFLCPAGKKDAFTLSISKDGRLCCHGFTGGSTAGADMAFAVTYIF